MIPLKINGKNLCEIFEPDLAARGFFAGMTDAEIISYSIDKQMFPGTVEVTSETYSRNAERTADYELEALELVNRKAKPEFTWSLIRANYVEKLLAALDYTYDFKNASGEIVAVSAPDISVTYQDFTGIRTINAYLGQTISGTLVEHAGVLYWDNFRIAFPER